MKTGKAIVAGGIAGLFALSAAGELLLEYKFDTGTTNTPNSGSVSGADLAFRAPGTGAPLTNATFTTGVSGQAGDYAFNTAATSMSGNGVVATTTVDVQAIDELTSFTISGWYKTDGTVSFVGSNARLVMDYVTGAGWQLLGNNNTTTPSYYFYADGGNIGNAPLSGTVLDQTQEWVFFAITYDGTLTANNLKFYGGDVDTAVALLHTATLNQGAMGDNDAAFTVGNQASRDRAFDGDIDNIRLHGEKVSDGSGVLSLAELEAIRKADVIPEPTTMLLFGVGVALCGWRRLRR